MVNGKPQICVNVSKMKFLKMSKIPFIPVTINEQNIQVGATEVLRAVRPQWIPATGLPNIKSKVFTEGLSNKLVGFFVEDNKEDIVIVKVFGTNTDNMIDRHAETETMKLLHERNCGAELYATFSNGICYQYMNGTTLEVEHCQDPKIYQKVAAEMARMHSEIKKEIDSRNDDDDHNGVDQVVPDGNSTNGVMNNNEANHRNFNFVHYPRSQIWDKLRQFNKLAEEVMATDEALRNTLEKIGVTPGWGTRAISELQSTLESCKDIPVTFCHNDLLPRNIVYDNKTEKITFIDVEYAMYNYAPFDVANHFLEFAGVEEIDYSKYPDQTFRKKWLEEYLKHFRTDQCSKVEITPEKYDCWVQLCVPLSHLLWGLWGVYQARHSTIEFDYVSYVELRLSEFQKHMDAVRQSKPTCLV